MLLNRDLFKESDKKKVDFLNKHYEYCYLDSMHHFNMSGNTKTIITGLSYGLSGLERTIVGNHTLNFAMNSQDIYYDFLHIKRAVKNARNIRTCVITLGYYSLYYDMSLTRNEFKCVGTYLPLFADMHSLKDIELYKKMYEKLIFEYGNEEKAFARCFFEKTDKLFYGKAILREHTNPRLLSEGGWINITPERREEYAYERTQLHNKHLKHIETYKENIGILNQMLEFLIEHQIRPIIVILPFSKEYLRYINPLYKESIMQVLGDSPYQLDFMDMNDETIFTDQDMQDCDHLNLKGAKKASLLVRGIIENVL